MSTHSCNRCVLWVGMQLQLECRLVQKIDRNIVKLKVNVHIFYIYELSYLNLMFSIIVTYRFNILLYCLKAFQWSSIVHTISILLAIIILLRILLEAAFYLLNLRGINVFWSYKYWLCVYNAMRALKVNILQINVLPNVDQVLKKLIISIISSIYR